MGSGGTSRASSDADEDMLDSSELAVADASQQRKLDEHLRARQEREEAYERALEQRRQELAALQAAAEAAADSSGMKADAAAISAPEGLPAGTAGGEEEQSELRSMGSGTSESKQPGTPDHDEDLGATGTASATPAVTGVAAADGAVAGSSSDGSGSSPEPEQALAQAASAPLAPADAAYGTSLLSSGLSALAAQQAQQPMQPQAQQGLLSGTFAGSGPLGLLQQQQAAAAAAALNISRPAGSASHGLLGGSGGSLFGSPAVAAGLAGLPGTAASLGGSVDGSLSSSLAGSPFPGATLGASSPSAARPLSAVAGLASMSPPGSLAPFPSPSSAPSRPPGLPPLPGSRSASFGAAMAAAAAGAVQAAGAASASAGSAADSDQLLSMRLQDALFVGSPAMASPGPHARRAASPQAISGHRHPLFAGLAPSSGQLGAGGEADDDADSIHLLSSSLSCLDDDASDGRGLLARTMSANGSLHGGFMVGSDASQRQNSAATAAAESLMAGLRQQGLLGSDLSDPALLAQLPGAVATSLGSPGGGSEGSAGSAAQRGGKDMNSDEVRPTGLDHRTCSTEGGEHV